MNRRKWGLTTPQDWLNVIIVYCWKDFGPRRSKTVQALTLYWAWAMEFMNDSQDLFEESSFQASS